MKKNDDRKEAQGMGLRPAKRLLFGLILAAIPLLLLLALELGLRIGGYGCSFPMFVDTELYDVPYRKCNPTYGKKYFQGETFTVPSNDMFLREKPSNGFRIFAIGSSTVYGFPYSSGVMFPRILHKRLQDSYPDRHIEVVNIAITAVNSFTFADRINEILEEEPDALIIYAGHNEFYGALGIGSKGGLGSSRSIKRLHLYLLNFRFYQLLGESINRVRNAVSNSGAEGAPETATLMERIVENKAIEYQGPIYQLAHRHYRQNMGYLLRQAQREGVPVFFSEVISNIKDLPPFGSVYGSDHPPAHEVYSRAKGLDSMGQYTQAREYYIQAKDLDGIRFRASEEINRIVRSLTENHGNHLVPMVSIFESRSPQGMIGNNLLTEHVHPNIDGLFLMADAFFGVIASSGVIGPLDSTNYKPSSYYRSNWGFTSLDSLYADLKIQHLMAGWPFKADTIINSFIHNYKPKSALDSAAFMVVKYEDISLESAHRRMAAYYKARNRTLLAAEEHYSITKIDPWDIRAYIEAGALFQEAGELEKALRVSLASLNIVREGIVLLRIGEIYSNLENYDLALNYLNEVALNHPNLQQNKVLTLIHAAYNSLGDSIRALEVYAKLSGIEQPSGSNQKVVVYAPASVRPKIEKAIRHLRANELDMALTLLLEANKQNESSIANRFIGEILLLRKDPQALSYLKVAFLDFQSDPVFLNTLCYASIMFNDKEYARKILSELRQLDPNNKNIKEFSRILSE